MSTATDERTTWLCENCSARRRSSASAAATAARAHCPGLLAGSGGLGGAPPAADDGGAVGPPTVQVPGRPQGIGAAGRHQPGPVAGAGVLQRGAQHESRSAGSAGRAQAPRSPSSRRRRRWCRGRAAASPPRRGLRGRRRRRGRRTPGRRRRGPAGCSATAHCRAAVATSRSIWSIRGSPPSTPASAASTCPAGSRSTGDRRSAGHSRSRSTRVVVQQHPADQLGVPGQRGGVPGVAGGASTPTPRASSRSSRRTSWCSTRCVGGRARGQAGDRRSSGPCGSGGGGGGGGPRCGHAQPPGSPAEAGAGRRRRVWPLGGPRHPFARDPADS